jgi:hypothetical protein
MNVIVNIKAIYLFAPPLASLLEAMGAFDDMRFVDTKSDHSIATTDPRSESIVLDFRNGDFKQRRVLSEQLRRD